MFLEISQNYFLIKSHATSLQLHKKETLAQVFPGEFCEISKSLLNCVPFVLACQRALRVYVLTYLRALRLYVLMCLRALRAHVLTCQCVLRVYMLTRSRAHALHAHV